MAASVIPCDSCGSPIPDSDLETGNAVTLLGKRYCAGCKTEAIQNVSLDDLAARPGSAASAPRPAPSPARPAVKAPPRAAAPAPAAPKAAAPAPAKTPAAKAPPPPKPERNPSPAKTAA